MNFLDTGTISNAYDFKKHFAIALAMYYELRRDDPSDKFVQTYQNTEMWQLYKMTSEEKLDMKHVKYKIYAYLHNMKDRVKAIHKST